MVIVYKGDNRLEGLSSDTKPTDVPKLTRFLETNTNIEWIFNTIGVWQQFGVGASVSESTTVSNASVGGVAITLPQSGYNLPFKGIAAGSSGNITVTDDPTNKNIVVDLLSNFLRMFTTVIYKSGSNYIAITTATGAILSSSTIAETVFQSAITNKGDIYVFDGTYDFSGSFVGLSFINFTKLTLSRNAKLRVPNNYNSYLFRLPSSCQNCIIEGGILDEQGVTAGKLWDAFLLDSVTDGVYSNTIRDIRILNTTRTLHLKISSASGWINGNYFEDIWSWWSKVAFVEFENITGGLHGFSHNNFTHCVFQGSVSDTGMIGVKNIDGSTNYFEDVEVWDVVAGQYQATVSSTATDTIIIGGIMTNPTYYIDNSSPSTTQIIDAYSKATFSQLTLRNPLAKTNTLSTTVYTDQPNTWVGFSQIFLDQTLKIHASSGTGNLIFKSNVANVDRTVTFPDVSSTVVLQISSDTFTINQKRFADNILAVYNPASTFLYNVRSSAITASRNITLPLLNTDDTFVFAGYPNTFSAGQTFNNYMDMQSISMPSNPNTNYGRLYVKSIDVNNDGVFALIKKNGSFVEVQIL